MKNLLVAGALLGTLAACSTSVQEESRVVIDAEKSAALERVIALSTTADVRHLSAQDRASAELGCRVVMDSTIVTTNPEVISGVARFCERERRIKTLKR